VVSAGSVNGRSRARVNNRRDMKRSRDSTHPVLIAGAGPAGCAAALYLARRGVPVIVFEGEAQLPLDLRASTFHPPTLDMLDELGVTERLIPQGLIAGTYQYRDRRTGEAAIFDLGMLADVTRHPFRLQCEQFKMTQVVVDMLAAFPHVQVLFNHRVEQVEQDAAGVTVHAETPEDGFRTYRGSYLIGADGANSRVRKSLAVNFEGFTYPERFLVVSTPFEFADAFPDLSYVNYVSDPEEWCVLLRTPTLWRVLVPTHSESRDADLLSDSFIQDRLHRLVDKPGDFEIGHRTLYRVHQRVAARWRVGRVMLVGDACHINNPLGGMGMNGGLHDTFNLVEKLYAILAGTGDDALLDLYERQRRTICVQFVQDHTIRNKKLMEEKDPDLQKRRQAEFMATAAAPALARSFLLRTSMIQSLRDAAAIQ
jgi:3-(3-hydroxy-phenyl)propionate hydroxylase